MLFPSVQREAFEEIRSVCGDRVPTIDDIKNMPYIEATMNEVCRWFPAPILGIPHALSRDEIYKDRVLKKGSVIISNV